MRMSKDALSDDDDDVDDDDFKDDAFENLAEKLLDGEDVDLDAFADGLSALGGGTDDALVLALGQRAGFLLARYNRHFGGLDRTTRDLDRSEVVEMIERVAAYADKFDDELVDQYGGTRYTDRPIGKES